MHFRRTGPALPFDGRYIQTRGEGSALQPAAISKTANAGLRLNEQIFAKLLRGANENKLRALARKTKVATRAFCREV
jgi:hypothetical protein